MPQKLIWTPIHPKTCAALSQNAVTHVASNPSEFGNNCPAVTSRGVCNLVDSDPDRSVTGPKLKCIVYWFVDDWR